MPTQEELRAVWKKEADEEAKQFAEDNGFEVAKIAERISERRELIIRAGDRSDMQLGSSSRYWLDCYIAALEGILEGLKVAAMP